MKEIVFKNVDEAEQAVVNEGQWNKYYTNTTAYGKKKVFRRNQVKRRGKQCDAGISLLFNSNNEEVVLFCDTSEHTHDLIQQKCTRIPDVTLTMDEAKWLGGQCNCPAFFKKFMCKHVVGLAIRVNYCKPPLVAKNIKIGEKRRRGRPSKTKKALLIQ